MRLNCQVVINYRQLQYQRNVSKRRSGFSTLSISLKPGNSKSPPVPLLIVCTAQNPAGTKYNLKDNIQQVFTKFVDEGKATIRVGQPEHDIIIKKADAVQLRGFLGVLRLALRGEDSVHFSQPPTKVAPPKETMTILKREDYPLRDFPSTVKKLVVAGCRLARIDSRVTALKHLSTLELSNNVLEALPQALARMALSQLILSNNRICNIDGQLFTGKLRETLHVLNLGQNKLSALPSELCHLKCLTTLNVQRNGLRKLPEGIGWLKSSLRSLDISHNDIEYLPASMEHMSLDLLCVSGNPLSLPDNAAFYSESFTVLGLSSLLDLAGQVVVRHRIRATVEDIPATLVQLLKRSAPCALCLSPLLPQASQKVERGLNLARSVAPGGTVVHNGVTGYTVASFGHVCYSCFLKRCEGNLCSMW